MKTPVHGSNTEVAVTPAAWVVKRGSSGVCGLWPVAEPSQNKRRRARSLIGR